jgi:mannose-6-phosphate isomerase-like protein (cupin superfamily)
MKTFHGFRLINPWDLHWRPSNLMKIPNADFLERTGSENLGARLWRLPPRSANTLHKHIRQEEFYFVLEGTGRLRVGEETLTVRKHGGVLVGPDAMRQVFNDTDSEVLWLIVGAPEELEFLAGSQSTKLDLKLIYPTDPQEMPRELAGVRWPPTEGVPGPATVAREWDAGAFANTWIADWNAHALERVLDHYAEDVEFFSPFIVKLAVNEAGVVRGKAALKDYFARGLKAYPELHFELIRVFSGVRSCVIEYRSVNGLLAAETMEFDAEGKVRLARAHYTIPESSQLVV